MCEYCGYEPNPLIKSVDLMACVDVFLGRLHVSHYNGQMWERKTAHINYCPKCGRDLSNEGSGKSEELCRQLGQVACEMWHYVVAHNTRDVPGVDMSGFEDKLEALGVRLYG